MMYWLILQYILYETQSFDDTNNDMNYYTISWIVFILISDFGANINYQVLPLGLSFNQLLNGSLSIASVTKQTEGMYTCTAQNGVRTGISKTINVTVNGKQKQKF